MSLNGKKLLLLSLPVLLAGCAVPHEKLTWVDTKPVAYSAQVPAPANGRSSVVVYRQSDALQGPTVNVYVNGEYSGSLEPNAYRQELVCSNHQRLDVEFTNTDPAYAKKATQGTYYNLPNAAVAYFKVVSVNGKPTLQSVSPEQAQLDLKDMPQQTHTLSRVALPQNCNTPSVVLKKYTLQAAALFKFNRADYANMLPKGKQELANVAQEIKNNPDRVEQIQVIGYTDPEGKESYNQRLSESRALTVKQALISGGIDGKLVQAQGLGEHDLVVTDCRAKYPKNAAARQTCDQPNRRVEIILHGQKAQ